MVARKKKDKEKRTNFDKVKKGTRLSETQYYEVINVTRGAKQGVRVVNERGFDFYIAGDIVEEGMFSADQFSEEIIVTRTELVETLETAGDSIFTVNFNKQPKPRDVTLSIQDLMRGKSTQKVTQKMMKEAMMGEERILIGYLISTEPKMGRSLVKDLEAEKRGESHDVRLVDHRTLNWMIFKNTKYIVKG